MAKKIIVTAIIAIFGFVVNFTACDNGTEGGNNPRPASPEPLSAKTAKQYFTDEGITAGWNLGDTLDAVRITQLCLTSNSVVPSKNWRHYY